MRVFTLGEDKSVSRREKYRAAGIIFRGKRGCKFVCFPFVGKYGEPTILLVRKSDRYRSAWEKPPLQEWQILWVKPRCSYMDRLENTTRVLQKIENRGKSSSGEISFTQGGNWGQLWGQFLLARTEFFFLSELRRENPSCWKEVDFSCREKLGMLSAREMSSAHGIKPFTFVPLEDSLVCQDTSRVVLV